jgi:hypothetical protein
MLGTYYYHQIIRKTVVSFGTLFNQIYISHKNEDSDIISKMRVPLAYGPRQKFLARLLEQPELNQKVQITLPRMSFEMNSIQYDSSRKTSVTQSFKAVDDNNRVKKVYMPVPYNIGFELNIITKLNDDALQIIEQILPYFQPSFNISIELIDSIGEKRDVPVVLESINFQDDYEGDFSTRRSLIYTLQFTAKTYLFGPIADSTEGLIRKVQVDYYSNTDVRNAKREVRYTATPTAMKDYDNDGSSSLTEDIDISETVLEVNDSSTISSGDRIIIDKEIMKVRSKSNNKLIVERAYSGTIAEIHLPGSSVNVLNSVDDSLIVAGDDFGFSEETQFFDNIGDFSPTRKIDI